MTGVTKSKSVTPYVAPKASEIDALVKVTDTAALDATLDMLRSFAADTALATLAKSKLDPASAALFVGAGRQAVADGNIASVATGKALYVLSKSGTFSPTEAAELIGVTASRISQLTLLGETVIRVGIPSGVTAGQLSTAISKGAGATVRAEIGKGRPSVAKVAALVKAEVAKAKATRKAGGTTKVTTKAKPADGATPTDGVALEQETAIKSLVDATAYLADRVGDKERFTDADVATISAAMRVLSDKITERRNNKNGQ